MMTGREDKNKKHKTASTSREAYQRLLKTRTFETQRFIIFEAIQNFEPVTSKTLSEKTGIERTSVSRALNNLVVCDNPQVKTAFKAICPITKKTVKYFSTIHWKAGELNFNDDDRD